uniref:ATP synthase F0 subunit 6 n=1 Tax=Lyperosomum longicauda TaxID=2714089 RepID=A0A6H0YBA4_9TREM|nr:ATP synthase F0 subunit 6 [Lyperosomum longicauda]QIX04653.1 ATP synthase F0 subunit 6 [Lyperosomum longicauda]
MCVSWLSVVMRWVCSLLKVGLSWCYCFILGGLLVGMFGLRVPGVFGFWEYSVFICLFVAPLFLSVVFGRLAGFRGFLLSFLPVGCPVYLAPFVFVIEMFSFLVVRSFVLVIRPIVNLVFGYFGVSAACYLMLNTGWVFSGMCLWLFMVCYEVFVTLLHWYIVCHILMFSRDY